MRSFFAVTLALVLTGSLFFKLGVIAWYTINKSEIVKELCIDKEKEVNTCQGNCELSKTLNLSEGKTESQELQFVTAFEALSFILPETIMCCSHLYLENNMIHFYQETELLGFTSDLLRPPILS
jgi:hypothetical protein